MCFTRVSCSAGGAGPGEGVPAAGARGSRSFPRVVRPGRRRRSPHRVHHRRRPLPLHLHQLRQHLPRSRYVLQITFRSAYSWILTMFCVISCWGRRSPSEMKMRKEGVQALVTEDRTSLSSTLQTEPSFHASVSFDGCWDTPCAVVLFR